MSKKISNLKNHVKNLSSKKKRTSSKIGLPPGSVFHVGEKKIEQTKVSLTEFNAEKCSVLDLKTVDEILPYINTPEVTWINVCGLHETEVIKQIGEKFNVHPLVIEDILNTETRPKLEITDNYIFAAMKLLNYNSSEKCFESEQVSFILGNDFVFSFLEKSDSIFNPVKERITQQLGKVRKSDSDYLFYALMDIIVDQYFLVLDHIENEIEELDDVVINDFDKTHIERIYNLKTQLLTTRRSIMPLREIFSELIREEPELIRATTQPYLKDLLDHTTHITETIDLQREISTGLMETYLSMMSNKMNEVMKVLTIIATIFIPLTFIVGIYGMNFENIPELGLSWGYAAVWVVMIIIAVIMLLFFRRKKWL
jgi:magnesium transporter